MIHPSGVIALLDAVLKHLRAHFESEETILKSIDYPQFVEYNGEHAVGKGELAELRRDLVNRKPSCLEEAGAVAIKRLFFKHVIAEDQRNADDYFEHVRAESP